MSEQTVTPCPFHQGYGAFSAEERQCAWAEMRDEADKWRAIIREALMVFVEHSPMYTAVVPYDHGHPKPVFGCGECIINASDFTGAEVRKELGGCLDDVYAVLNKSGLTP